MLEHNHLARSFRAAASSDTPSLTWSADDELEAFEIGAIVARPGFSRNIVVSRSDGLLGFSFAPFWDVVKSDGSDSDEE